MFYKYADDAAIFINPNQNKLEAVKDILKLFVNSKYYKKVRLRNWLNYMWQREK